MAITRTDRNTNPLLAMHRGTSPALLHRANTISCLVWEARIARRAPFLAPGALDATILAHVATRP